MALLDEYIDNGFDEGFDDAPGFLMNPEENADFLLRGLTRAGQDAMARDVYGDDYIDFSDVWTMPVYEGGRVSVFNESIPPSFIKKVCVDDGNCIDADKLYGLPDWEMLYMFEKNRGER